MYGTKNYDEAVDLAARASREGYSPFLPDKRLVRYEVRAHRWAPNGRLLTWGVYPRWSYSDMPAGDQSFGGPFVPLDKLRQLPASDQQNEED